MPRKMIGFRAAACSRAGQLGLVLIVVLATSGLSACSSTSTGNTGTGTPAADTGNTGNTGDLTSTTDTSNTGNTGDFCSAHTCIPNFPNGTGYIVQCADGEWSHSGGRPGACSDHGGETGNTPGNTGNIGNTGDLTSTTDTSNTGNTGNTGDFCSAHTCIPNFPNGTGYIVQCADGEWSHSGGRPGACSDHGGETGNTAGSGRGSSGNSGSAPENSGNSGSGSSGAAPPSGPSPTGQDSAGYNTGPGCSDDPHSPLSGCSDSPSTPNGDPNSSCPNGITVDAQTTTCGLAENVYSNYSTDGQVSATSPKTGHTIMLDCQTGGSGTTGYTICEGQDGAATLYLRWHK